MPHARASGVLRCRAAGATAPASVLMLRRAAMPIMSARLGVVVKRYRDVYVAAHGSDAAGSAEEGDGVSAERGGAGFQQSQLQPQQQQEQQVPPTLSKPVTEDGEKVQDVPAAASLLPPGWGAVAMPTAPPAGGSVEGDYVFFTAEQLAAATPTLPSPQRDGNDSMQVQETAVTTSAEEQQQGPAEEEQQQQKVMQPPQPAPAAAPYAAGWPPHAGVPPPLVDVAADIANNPAYAIRLLDILDQVPDELPVLSAAAGGAPVAAAAAAQDEVCACVYACAHE
jgi:hypothetical protein